MHFERWFKVLELMGKDDFYDSILMTMDAGSEKGVISDEEKDKIIRTGLAALMGEFDEI